MDTVPIINISPLLAAEGDIQAIENVSCEIVNSLKKFGFIYIQGHGISLELIQKSFKASKHFFEQHSSEKNRFLRGETENWGYVPYRMETFEKSKPFDLKECFNYYPTEKRKDINNIVPGFEEIQKTLFVECTKVTYALMRCISKALPYISPPCEDYLKKNHDIGVISKNPSAMRLLYYPVIENNDDVLDGQLRCGEHSDYGTITLLFQDEAGGLQIVSPSGDYIDVKPIPGTMVVNIGDLLEIWSSKEFKSTRHRVVIPSNACSKPRQSIAFFVSPNNDVTVTNLDNSGMHEPVNALEYLLAQFAKSY